MIAIRRSSWKIKAFFAADHLFLLQHLCLIQQCYYSQNKDFSSLSWLNEFSTVMKKNWGRPGLPLFKGLDDPPPPLPYLKLWIRHCLTILSRWSKVAKKGYTILLNLGRELDIGVQRVKMFWEFHDVILVEFYKCVACISVPYGHLVITNSFLCPWGKLLWISSRRYRSGHH